MKKRNIAVTSMVMVLASVIMAMSGVLVGCSNEVFEPETASVTVSLPSSARHLYEIADIKKIRIQVLLLKSDQETLVREEYNNLYTVEEFPVTIPKLIVGYTRVAVEALDGIGGIIAKGQVIKQLKAGANSLALNLAWAGSDTPTVPDLPGEELLTVDYNTSASMALSLLIRDETYEIYMDLFDPLERTTRKSEPLTIAAVYLGDYASKEIPVSYRWMQSTNCEDFIEIANGNGVTRAYIEPLEVKTEDVGIYYIYLEVCSDNGTRQNYRNSALYTIRVIDPPPPVYRAPTNIGRIARNTSLVGDTDAVLASVGNTLALREGKSAVVSWKIQYQDSGYLKDPRTVFPAIEASENVSVISTEIDSADVPVYVSCLISMSESGIGWIECSAGEHKLRLNIIAATEIIKDGTWFGSGKRLTETISDEYAIKSAHARTTHIVYLYGSQSQTNYALNTIQAFVDDAEAPVDILAFRSTSIYGHYEIDTPHTFTVANDFKDTRLRFKIRSGDYTAFIGWVFSYYE
jgi:hypothetical protein